MQHGAWQLSSMVYGCGVPVLILKRPELAQVDREFLTTKDVLEALAVEPDEV